MASGYSAKRFEENRGNRKLCHLNPFEFFDYTGCSRVFFSAFPCLTPELLEQWVFTRAVVSNQFCQAPR